MSGARVRNPLRAYDRGRAIEPVTLGNMREHGVRAVDATCEACKHEAVVNVDNLADDVYVPDVAVKLRCSACGSKNVVCAPIGRSTSRLAVILVRGSRSPTEYRSQQPSRNRVTGISARPAARQPRAHAAPVLSYGRLSYVNATL
jgi:hypothetical protein